MNMIQMNGIYLWTSPTLAQQKFYSTIGMGSWAHMAQHNKILQHYNFFGQNNSMQYLWRAIDGGTLTQCATELRYARLLVLPTE